MVKIHPESIREIGAISYRDRLRTGMIGRKAVPILQVSVGGLPSGLSGLVVLSDLQGSGGSANAPRLPTFDALDELVGLAAAGAIPPLKDMVGVSTGDLYAILDLHKRGGSGDVRGPWLAMRQHFRAVVGVAGNHDLFGATPAEHKDFRGTNGVHLLDGESVAVAGVRFGGISGVIGDPKRPFRRFEADFHAEIDRLVQGRPDILLLHQGPVVSLDLYRSNDGIRDRCARLRGGLVLCGHNHTEQPFDELATGTQVLSAHERVIVLTAA